MGVKVAKSQQPPVKTPDAEPRDLETLVRQLVAYVEHGEKLPPPAPSAVSADRDPASEDVLVDCEIDGVRCVLARANPAPSMHLSPREREIARMIAKGYPNKIIASVLDISVWTVSTHLRRMFAKLGVTSRAALVTTIFNRGKL